MGDDASETRWAWASELPGPRGEALKGGLGGSVQWGGQEVCLGCSSRAVCGMCSALQFLCGHIPHRGPHCLPRQPGERKETG